MVVTLTNFLSFNLKCQKNKYKEQSNIKNWRRYPIVGSGYRPMVMSVHWSACYFTDINTDLTSALQKFGLGGNTLLELLY